MDNIQFGDLLRDMLDSRGISQKWLADNAETTESTISRYLNGKNQPEINIVARIAKALGVSMDYLCGLTDNPTPREHMGGENILLIRCFKRADTRDKKVVWSVLERYVSTKERQLQLGSYGEVDEQTGFDRTGTKGS